jgi:hypothetical protein
MPSRSVNAMQSSEVPMSQSNQTNESSEPAPAVTPDGVAFHEQVHATGGRSTAARAGIVAGAALLVAVGVVAAMGASPAPSPAADPTTGTGANPSAPAASASPGTKVPGRGFGMPGLRDGFGVLGGLGRSTITITAVDGSAVTLKTDDGWSRTITVTSTTTITKGGAAIAVGDLAVGDDVRFRQERAADGTYTVTAIVVVLPSVAGQVTAIDGGTLTVTQPGGTSATIHVDADTTYRVDGAAGALSDLKVGSFIVAEGTQRADGSLDAVDIRAGELKGRGFGWPGFPGGHDGQKDPNASPAPSSGAS